MSNVPYYLEKARSGHRLGHAQATDGLIKDGLWDVYNNIHMVRYHENFYDIMMHVTKLS